MAITVKVERVGDELVIKLPKDALAHQKANVGDTLELVKHPEGFLLSTYDAELSRQMKAMRHVMQKHRDVLQMLSKS